MAKPNNISVSAVSIPSKNGSSKKYYSIDVIDPNTGKPVGSYNTTDEAKAKKYIEQQKQANPGATVNGNSPGAKGYDAFGPDGSVPSQTQYEMGGFEEATCETKTVVTPDGTDEVQECEGTGNVYGPELNDMQAESPPPRAPDKIAKNARDHCGISEKRLQGFKNLTEKERAQQKVSGVFNSKRLQPMIERETAPSELVVARGPDNNSFIVVGNDRPGKLHTGWGGKGHTQSDAIDLVAGMGGHCTSEVIPRNKTGASDDGTEEKVKVNPNFFMDSARIYISAKTDVDKNFGLRKFRAKVEDEKDHGKYGAKSAVAAKADNIRLIGRESIQFVTGTDQKNSQGGTIHATAGIELIAMNQYEKTQPLVLGDNLQLALITVLDNVEALAKIMHGYIKYQMKYNQALQQHTHVSPFFGIITLPSEGAIVGGIQCDLETASKTEISILKHITNLQGVKSNFLLDSGESFINSRYNKSN